MKKDQQPQPARKRVRPLVIHKDVLRRLEASELHQVAAGMATNKHVSCLIECV
jgi:hypothetical protein